MTDERKFQQHEQIYYQVITEERIREIIREEIILYNETFMKSYAEEKNVTEN